MARQHDSKTEDIRKSGGSSRPGGCLLVVSDAPGPDRGRSLRFERGRVRIGSHELIVALVAGGSRRAGDAAAHGASSGETLDDLHDAGVVVADAKVTRLYGFARRVAASSATILVLGETGSGIERSEQSVPPPREVRLVRRSDGSLMLSN